MTEQAGLFDNTFDADSKEIAPTAVSESTAPVGDARDAAIPVAAEGYASPAAAPASAAPAPAAPTAASAPVAPAPAVPATAASVTAAPAAPEADACRFLFLRR